MKSHHEDAAKWLERQQIMTHDEVTAVQAYRLLNIFSVHNEVQFLMYLAVLLFTGGAGILVYENIDTIGHTILLALLLGLTVFSFWYLFKKAPAFSKNETDFPNPGLNYLVLAATIMGGTFINYLEIQYHPFGNRYAWPALITAVLSLFVAYRFDNRPALTIGITALATTIGITATPQALVEADFFNQPTVLVSGIVLAALLALVFELSYKENLKKHFGLTYLTFSLHLLAICSICGMIDDYWFFYALPLAGASWYHWLKSHETASVSLFVFTLIYAYFGLNIALVRLLILANTDEILTVFALISPVYSIGSIALFIIAVRRFNKANS